MCIGHRKSAIRIATDLKGQNWLAAHAEASPSSPSVGAYSRRTADKKSMVPGVFSARSGPFALYVLGVGVKRAPLPCILAGSAARCAAYLGVPSSPVDLASGIHGAPFQFGRTSTQRPRRPHFPHLTRRWNDGTCSLLVCADQ
jgi:hypothetical protein